MPAQYDESGNYIYPEGYRRRDGGVEAPGYESQQAEWEAQYAGRPGSLGGPPEADPGGSGRRGSGRRDDVVHVRAGRRADQRHARQ